MGDFWYKIGFILFGMMLILAPGIVSAQTEINLTKTFQITPADSVFFLDHWVVEGSIMVKVEPAEETIQPDGNWSFNYITGMWRIRDRGWLPEADTVKINIRYAKIPYGFPRQFAVREIAEIHEDEDSELDEGERFIRPRVTSSDIFGTSTLQRSGSISRGVTVGTNQDMTLQSGLRFELSGYITDNVEILATLTDQSTPIQPDGSTQNLREFDKVYIRLRHPSGSVQLGDIDVNLRNSHFAQISRRLQGVDVQTSDTDYGAYSASAAVVRGRFRTQTFTGRTGVQGPYRLTGGAGEQFIIVLAGTERVYLNGARMTRGEENDYIIDYGLGEVTFTNRRMITEHSRITIDYEYVTQEYNRTLLTAEGNATDLLDGRLMVGATFIRETDNRDLNTEFGLTDEERRILRLAGNDPDRMIISGADSVGFRRDADFILYARVDTTFQGTTYRIFKNLPGDERGAWRVSFSRVGMGNGAYRRVGSNVNGIVYEWVGPGMGEYEPFRRIPAPQMQQMLALHSRYAITQNLEIFGEWAGSEFDRNRFSDLDNEQNKDMGYLTGIRMKPVETVLGKLDFEVRHRYAGEHFAYFDRTREVEFDRKWDVLQTDGVQERITEAEAGVAFTDFSMIRTEVGYMDRPDLNSLRWRLRAAMSEPELPQAAWQMEYIQTERESVSKGNWFRQYGETSYSIPILGITATPSFHFEHENREQRLPQEGGLLPGSFRFVDVIPGLHFRFSDALSAGARVSYRKDDMESDGALIPESEAWTREYSTLWSPAATLRTSNSLILRDKTYTSFFIENQAALNTKSVLVRSDTEYRSGSGFLDAGLLYEGGTESKPLLQETYIEVGPELGNYVWIDLNGDGVQQIDEFFPAQTVSEGTFVRQFIPTDELFPVVSVRVGLRTRVSPHVLFENGDGLISDILSNIEWSSMIDIREQNRSGNVAGILLLGLNRFQDNEETIDGRIYWQQDFRLFRQLSRLNGRVTIDRSKGMNRRASGLEEHRSGNVRVEAGYQIDRRWNAAMTLKTGQNDLISEVFQSRSYRIRSRGMEPSVRYAHTRSLMTGVGFGINKREDILPVEPVSLTSYTVFTDVRWFHTNRIQTFARFEFRANNLSGQSSSFGTFELTEGAGEGNTWHWNIQGTYRISDFIRATLNYDGRTVVERPAIQTLRFTLNAFF